MIDSFQKKAVFADYTKGFLLKHVFYVLFSLACAAIVRNLVQIVDMLFLSWLNDTHITAGVGFASAVLRFALPIGLGMSVATGTIAGHYMGTKNIKGVKHLLIHSVTINFAFSTFLCLMAFIFRRQFFHYILNGSDDVYPYFIRYLIPMLLGAPLMHMNLLFTTVRSSIGDLKGTLYLTIIMSITNTLLDPIFIFLFHWGSFGAGLASLISMIVITVLGYLRFKYKFEIWGKFRSKKIMQDFVKLMKYFIPSALAFYSPTLFDILNIKMASSYGKDIVATIAIINLVVQFFIGTVIYNMSGAVAPVVAQNFSKGEYGRITEILKSAVLLAVGFTVIITCFFNFGGSELIAYGFHLKGEPHKLIVTYLNYISAGWVFTGICFVCIGCLNAIGKPTYGTFINVFRMLLLGIPLMFVFHKYLAPHYAFAGPLSPYLGSMTGGFVASIISSIVVVKIVNKLKSKKI